MYSFALYAIHYIVIICIILTIINIFYCAFFKHYLATKRVKKSLLLTNNQLTIIKNHDADSDFILKIANEVYYVKVIDVPKNCELQINNIDAFYYYKNSKNALKIHKINDMSKFMKSKINNRIIILSNKAKAIKMYINECEMIKVNENINVYNTHILNFNEYNFLFKNEQ